MCPAPLSLGQAQGQRCQQEQDNSSHLLRGWEKGVPTGGEGALPSGSPARCSRTGPAPRGIIRQLLWASDVSHLPSNLRRLGIDCTMRTQGLGWPRGHRTGHSLTSWDSRGWAPSSPMGQSQGGQRERTWAPGSPSPSHSAQADVTRVGAPDRSQRVIRTTQTASLPSQD